MRSDERRPSATVTDLEPRRLREGHGPAAEAARAFHGETAARDIDEGTSWQRVAFRQRQERTSAWRGRRRWLAGATLATAAAAVGLFLLPSSKSDQRLEPSVVAVAPPRSVAPPREPSRAPMSAAAAAIPIASSRPRPRMVLSAAPRALPVGPVELDGAARAELAPGGRALASTDAGNTRVSLTRGSLRLDVEPREPGRRFQVEIGPYRFVDLGTSFRVARSGQSVELWVSQGRVAVWRAEHLGQTVAAGGHWSGTLPVAAALAMDAPAPTPRPTLTPTLAAAPASPARSEALTPCETAAGAGRSQEALDCYRRIGGGDDLAAELALYEAARLELRLTGDVRAALETLAAHDRRFPRGPLCSEVELTRVELLPRVGEHRRALEESERILREHPDHERRRELRLLRGNIFREALGDCERAEPEYAAASDGAGRAADDANFYRAVCVETLGRLAEAAGAYRGYLARARPAHEAEARKRLSTLQP